MPTSDHEADRAAMRDLLRANVKYGQFTLASGKTSDFYFDGRLITLNPAGMELIGRLVAAEAARFPVVTAIGGPATGAIAIGVAACLHLRQAGGRDVQSFFVRKQAKEHGTAQQIEGPPLSETSQVIVVEDVVTSGGSVLRAVDAIRATGATVLDVIPLLDREEGAAEAFAAAGVPLTPLFRRSELA
jgi:orotate phosphoribosyltransferase